MPAPDLAAATIAVDLAQEVVAAACRYLAGAAIDEHQVVAYDLAHTAAAITMAAVMVGYGEGGEVEARLATAFVADCVTDLLGRLAGREEEWGAKPGALDGSSTFLRDHRSPAFLASLGGPDTEGPRHLDADFELVGETFRRFADEQVRPVAEHVHRRNADIPEELIAGLAAMGGFGLSVPERYGGFASGGESDYLGMVVATEELSRAALRAGGSRVTPPECHTP
ncbi:MAG: acyl-CoA dehydrogenase family protein, partial [Acidimicrobiales bacterium]